MKGLILTYLLTVGGSAAALFNPFIGVCIYWIFDIVRPQYVYAWAGTQGDFSQLIAIATIIGWGFKNFGDWKMAGAKPIYLCIAGATIWSFLSALFAPDHAIAVQFVIDQAKRFLMFTIAVTTITSLGHLRALSWVLAGSAGYVGYELNMRYLGGSNEAQWTGYGGMDNNCLAISMVTCLGVALFLALQAGKVWQKALALIAALLIGHTVLLTFSRGGMLGLIVVAVAAFSVVPKRPRNVLALVVALAVALSLAGPEVRARFLTSFAEGDARDASAQSRVELWGDCIEVMEKYPLFGVGPNHWHLVAAEFGWPAGKEAHSMWLQAGAEIGVPGLLFLFSAYWLALYRGWRQARSARDDPEAQWLKGVACMAVAALAGYMVSVQFVSLVGLETPLYVLAIAIGSQRLMARLPELEPSRTPDHPRLARVPVVPFAARAVNSR